jgi:hypothetical protein
MLELIGLLILMVLYYLFGFKNKISGGGLNDPISHVDKNPKHLKLYTILNDKFPTKKYQSGARFVGSMHWGQLKLFLSEMEFFNKIPHEQQQIIYVGAAPGTHIDFLSELFPHFKFDLYDKNNFVCKENDKIKIFKEYFTDETAIKYIDKDVILISDIRRTPDSEEVVKEDMQSQLNWWKIIKPKLSMFKFRLPFDDKFTEYPEGEIHFQCFPGAKSSETRLIVNKNAKIVKYDNRKYEEQLFYHNYFSRTNHFNHPKFPDTYNLTDHHFDNCYDCMKMITIVDEYLTVNKKSNKQKDIINLMKTIQQKISNGYQNILTETMKHFDKAKLRNIKH